MVTNHYVDRRSISNIHDRESNDATTEDVQVLAVGVDKDVVVDRSPAVEGDGVEDITVVQE